MVIYVTFSVCHLALSGNSDGVTVLLEFHELLQSSTADDVGRGSNFI